MAGTRSPTTVLLNLSRPVGLAAPGHDGTLGGRRGNTGKQAAETQRERSHPIAPGSPPPYHPRPFNNRPRDLRFSMLQELRKWSKSWISSLFLGGLAVSFVVWGIADVFRSNVSTTVASVGP